MRVENAEYELPCIHSGTAVYRAMHTVVETLAFVAAAKDVGMTETERDLTINTLAGAPESGAIMPGTGGARKVRIAKEGKGKSGGYRVITYFGGDDIPVFLLTVFGKGEKANLTKGECNELSKLVKMLRSSYTKEN